MVAQTLAEPMPRRVRTVLGAWGDWPPVPQIGSRSKRFPFNWLVLWALT